MENLRMYGLLLLLLLLSACQTAPNPTPKESQARIEFTSERSIIFTKAGESTRLSAVVYDDNGNINSNAKVSFSSSDPSIAQIDSSGTVTAKSDFGSATIIASYGDLPTQIATILIAEFKSQTRQIASSDVVSVNAQQTQIVLLRNPVTENLGVGQVLISGERGGVLAKVKQISLSTDQITLVTEAASLSDAFKRLSLNITAPKIRLPLRNAHLQSQALPAMECTSEVQGLSVALSGGSINNDLDLVPHFIMELGEDTEDTFAIYADLVMNAEISAVLFTFSGGVTGKINCEATLVDTPIPPVVFIGPFGLSNLAIIKTGFDLEAGWSVGNLKLSTPTIKKTITASLGLKITESSGVEFIDSVNVSPEIREPGATELEWESNFTAKLEPYFAVDMGLASSFFGIPMAKLPVIQSKLFGGFEIGLQGPVLFNQKDYQGPKWSTYAGLNTNLNPLLESLEPLKTVIEKIKPSLAERLSSILASDLTLFETKNTFFTSPRPQLSASRSRLDEQNPTVNFTVTTNEVAANAGGTLEIYALKNGETFADQVATGIFNNGQGSVSWTPSSSEQGTFTLFALLKNDLISGMFPYASNTITLEVDSCLDEVALTTLQVCEEPEPEPEPEDPALKFLGRGRFSNNSVNFWTEAAFYYNDANGQGIKVFDSLKVHGPQGSKDFSVLEATLSAAGAGSYKGTSANASAQATRREALLGSPESFSGANFTMDFTLDTTVSNPPASTAPERSTVYASTSAESCIGFRVIGKDAVISFSGGAEASDEFGLYFEVDFEEDSFEYDEYGASHSFSGTYTLKAGYSYGICYRLRASAEQYSRGDPGYPKNLQGNFSFNFSISQ